MLVTRRSFLIFTGMAIASPAVAQHRHEWDVIEKVQYGQPPGNIPWLRLPSPRCVDNGETRIGYPGFEHCRLHPDYQIAFANWNCQCYTGQCRPTLFRATKHTYDPETYVPGYEIYVSGMYYPIPRGAFRTEKAKMSKALLAYDAHICCSEATLEKPPHIECAWLKLEA